MKSEDIPKIRRAVYQLRAAGFNFSRMKFIRSYFYEEYRQLFHIEHRTELQIIKRCKLVRNIPTNQSTVKWEKLRPWANKIDEKFQMTNKEMIDHAICNDWLIVNFDETHVEKSSFAEVTTSQKTLGLKGQIGQKKSKHPNAMTFLLGITNKNHALQPVVVTKSKKRIQYDFFQFINIFMQVKVYFNIIFFIFLAYLF